MRLALRTQISIALVAILLGLLFASAIVTAMMRSVGNELGEIEASASATAGLHELSVRFDGARSVLDAFVRISPGSKRSPASWSSGERLYRSSWWRRRMLLKPICARRWRRFVALR